MDLAGESRPTQIQFVIKRRSPMPSGKSALKTTSIKVNLIPRHPVFEEYLHVEIFCDFSRKHEVLLLLRLSSVLLYTNLLLRFTCGLTNSWLKISQDSWESGDKSMAYIVSKGRNENHIHTGSVVCFNKHIWSCPRECVLILVYWPARNFELMLPYCSRARLLSLLWS